MRTYKNICLWIVITIFACSLYSKGSVEKEWNPMRWKVDNKACKLTDLSPFSIPEEGDSFIFECINYADLHLVEIIDTESSHEVTDLKQATTSWGRIKCQGNRLYLTLYPNKNTEQRSLQIKVSSGSAQQNISLLQAGKPL